VGAVSKSQTGAGRVACHPTVAAQRAFVILLYHPRPRPVASFHFAPSIPLISSSQDSFFVFLFLNYHTPLSLSITCFLSNNSFNNTLKTTSNRQHEVPAHRPSRSCGHRRCSGPVCSISRINHFNDFPLTLIPSNSILGVLQTALPSSLVAEAITNSAAVASEIASQFAAGETPTWYSALPTDIQSYLMPSDAAGVSSLTAAASSLVTGGVSAVTNATSSASSASITTAPGSLGTGSPLLGPNGTVATPNGTLVGPNGTTNGNSTNLSSSMSSSSSGSSSSGSGSGSGSNSGSNSGSGSSSESSTGTSDSAAAPTAFYGIGLAGVVGMVGVLAL
jgi:uncharacterized membrane protein YgcG